jgi:hypothetical protein
LITRLQGEPAIAKVDFAAVLDPRNFVGRGPQQVVEFLGEHVGAVRQRYDGRLNRSAELKV